MKSAAELVARSRNLVSLPEVYLRIRALLNDPGSGMDDFSRLVQSDPALSARVLRIANSAFFGVSRKVETLSLAINLMGIARLHDLALATSVISGFGDQPLLRFDINTYWHNSIHSGILARLLAVECGIFDSERLFVAGLLHDIGHLLMYMQMPEQAIAAIGGSRASARPLHLVEREMLGFDYGEVGAELMASWSFPDSLRDVCRHHMEPAASGQFARECALVGISRHVAHAANDRGALKAHQDELDDSICRIAGVGADAVERVSAEALTHLAEVIAMLMPGTSG